MKKIGSPQTKELSEMALAAINNKYNRLEGNSLKEIIHRIKNVSCIVVVNKREAIDVAIMHRREAAMNQLAI